MAITLIGVSIALVGCGGGDDGGEANNSTPVDGIWTVVVSLDNLTYTPASGFSMSGETSRTASINQEGTQLSGMVKGTVEGANVNFIIPIGAWDDWTITCVGNYAGNTMQGTWSGTYINGIHLSNGTWSANRQ